VITVTALWLCAAASLMAAAGFTFELQRPGAGVTYLMYTVAAAAFAVDTFRLIRL
jgi:hypothetical protein